MNIKIENRLNRFDFWGLMKLKKMVMFLRYHYLKKFKWKQKPLDLVTMSKKTQLEKVYYEEFSKECIAEIEKKFLGNEDFLTSGLLCMNVYEPSGRHVNFGDTLKWHGIYMASLYRMGDTTKYINNLYSLEASIYNNIRYKKFWKLINDNGRMNIVLSNLSGLSQALLVPPDTAHVGVIKKLKQKVYEQFEKFDFKVPLTSTNRVPFLHEDTNHSYFDLKPNIFSNSESMLAYACVKAIGGELTKNDIWFLKQALSNYESFSCDLHESSFRSVHNSILFVDSLMSSKYKKELEVILYRHTKVLLNMHPGTLNPEILSVLYHHWKENYQFEILSELSWSFDLPPYKKTVFGKEGNFDRSLYTTLDDKKNISCEVIPSDKRRMYGYYWEKSPYRFLSDSSIRCNIIHPRLDFVSVWSKIRNMF